MIRYSNFILKSVCLLSLIYFTYLMTLITLQYIPVKFDVAFLAVKQNEIEYKYYQIAFFSHVYTSIFVLIFGIFQFSKRIRTKFKKIHKILGGLYVFIILLVAAPSGFIMALHANGGIFSKLSFVIQAIVWFWFTLMAFRSIRKLDLKSHLKFMYRSYALTLSAISLRLFKWIIVSTIELPPMDTYKIVSWLGWLFNLSLVEIYLMYSKDWKKKKSTISNQLGT
ncbi:MAG: DUF2306 domain-containing protein [Bacteroidota bacterium]